MTTTTQPRVGGETVQDLADALRNFRPGPPRNGMVRVTGTIDPPALRALMRIEAELLLSDADALPGAPEFDRTYDERRADAFVLLVERMASHLPPRDRPERSKRQR